MITWKEHPTEKGWYYSSEKRFKIGPTGYNKLFVCCDRVFDKIDRFSTIDKAKEWAESRVKNDLR